MKLWTLLSGLSAVCALAIVRVGASVAADSVALGAAHFSGGAAHVHDVEIALAAIGRAVLTEVDGSATAIRAGDEVRFVRALGVVEWWRSVPEGMEQGVTIDVRPDGDGPLVLEVSVGAGITPEGEETIALRDARGLRATY